MMGDYYMFSLGLQNTIDVRQKISYQGKQYSPEDALEAAGVNKVIVMLGFNDIALYGIECTKVSAQHGDANVTSSSSKNIKGMRNINSAKQTQTGSNASVSWSIRICRIDEISENGYNIK